MINNEINVKYKMLSKSAVLPSKAHETDSGWDLTLIGVEKIDGDVIFFKTGISVQPPPGYYFELFPRSSISKLPLSLANSVGVIDESYTGEVLVAVRVHHQNMGYETKSNSYPNGIVSIFGLKPQTMSGLAELILSKKTKLAQLVLRKRIDFKFISSEIEETQRGSSGFGSSDSRTEPQSTQVDTVDSKNNDTLNKTEPDKSQVRLIKKSKQDANTTE